MGNRPHLPTVENVQWRVDVGISTKYVTVFVWITVKAVAIAGCRIRKPSRLDYRYKLYSVFVNIFCIKTDRPLKNSK